MKGCLTLPFRLAFLAILILGGYLAWTHRREIEARIHRWTAGAGAPDSLAIGNPAGASAALAKLGSLNGRADSVVLAPADLANLLAAVSERLVPGALDSVQVGAGRDALELRGRVDTRRLPLSFGPLSGVVRDHENVEAGGELLFRHAGLAEWRISSARVRGIPIPRDVLTRLLSRYGGDAAGVVPVVLPPAVAGLRVSPAGLVLYGRAAGVKP
jgi:hypothetical protein